MLRSRLIESQLERTLMFVDVVAHLRSVVVIDASEGHMK
jgi:hypothetical protein